MHNTHSVLLVGPSAADPGNTGLIEAFIEALPDWTPQVSNGAIDALHLRRASAVIVAGGTVFAAEFSDQATPTADLVPAAWALHAGAVLARPVALVGVGVARVTGRAARRARRMADRSSLLVLRDEESADALQCAGATPPFRIGADPTWTLLDRRPVAPHQADGGTILIPGGDAVANARLAGMLDGLGCQFGELPWGEARVGPPALPSLPAPAGLAEARDIIAGAALVVTLRLHGLIAAASAGVPAVAVGASPGLGALAARLGQPWIGGAVSASTLRAATQTATAASRQSVKTEVARAEEGFRLLRLLLSGGDSDEAETIGGLPLAPVTWER